MYTVLVSACIHTISTYINSPEIKDINTMAKLHSVLKNLTATINVT